MDFEIFKERVKAVVFPLGEPENLVAIHDTFIVDGLNEIQSYVKCYRDNNVDVVAFADTRYNCGLTVAEAPKGFIKRVYSIADDWCCKVNYRKSTKAQITFLEAQHKIDYTNTEAPDQTGKPALNLGDQYPAENADDATYGRAVTGYWALEGCRMYVWPHLESTEDLVIEWTGIKDNWSNADIVFSDTPAVIRTVRLFLQREIARDLDCDDAKFAKYTREFNDSLAGLVWDCRQQLEGTHAEEDLLPTFVNGCVAPGNADSTDTTTTTDDEDDSTDTEDDVEYTFAVVGRYGTSTAGTVSVASLVNGWDPDFVITTGGNVLDFGGTADQLDTLVGQHYHQYIYPYQGTYGSGASDRNHFWPCISDQEAASTTKAEVYRSFFSLPSGNDGYYYDRIEGPVHFFFLCGLSGFADGITDNSAQAEWLKVRLSTSPCKYKVVVVYNSPYNSFGSEVTTLRWPFKAWGATVVLSGSISAYERLYADGIPYLLNGLGGAAPTAASTTPSLYSDNSYVDSLGAQLVTVKCNSLKFDFYSVDGELVDTLEIT